MSPRAFLILAPLSWLWLSFSPQPTKPRSSEQEDTRPVAIFADLDGRWKGTFVGYDVSGKELYRISVEQTYRTVSDTTQEVKVLDQMPDGSRIEGKGRNIAKRLPDGTLELLCIVDKSNGDHVEHRGRVIRGPDGDKQIIWWSKSEERTETFRESVRTEEGREVYSIDGMGRYGETMMLMHGRYYRPEPDADK